MAQQDFLDGGYRGKLGQTVGVLMRNKYYVRTYVKPRDPMQPDQLAERLLFKTASSLSQEARLVNGNDGLWDTSEMNEYTKRLQQALKHLQAGESIEDSFPLYPDGYVPPPQLNVINPNIDGVNGTFTATLTGMDDYIGMFAFIQGFNYLANGTELSRTSSTTDTQITSATMTLTRAKGGEDWGINPATAVMAASIRSIQGNPASEVVGKVVASQFTKMAESDFDFDQGATAGTWCETYILAPVGAAGLFFTFEGDVYNNAGQIVATALYTDYYADRIPSGVIRIPITNSLRNWDHIEGVWTVRNARVQGDGILEINWTYDWQ